MSKFVFQLVDVEHNSSYIYYVVTHNVSSDHSSKTVNGTNVTLCGVQPGERYQITFMFDGCICYNYYPEVPTNSGDEVTLAENMTKNIFEGMNKILSQLIIYHTISYIGHSINMHLSPGHIVTIIAAGLLTVVLPFYLLLCLCFGKSDYL